MGDTNYSISALSYGTNGWTNPLYIKSSSLATSSFYLSSKSQLDNSHHTWSVKGI